IDCAAQARRLHRLMTRRSFARVPVGSAFRLRVKLRRTAGALAKAVRRTGGFAIALLLACGLLHGQGSPDWRGYDAAFFKALRWRSIGPFRGGRVTAVAGVPGQPLIYYMGATGGGVWKTDDAGITWAPITDGFVKTGSVGAIAVAPSDANVIYGGRGQADHRHKFCP